MHFKNLSSKFQKRPGLSRNHWEHALHSRAQADNTERGQAMGVLGWRDKGSTLGFPSSGTRLSKGCDTQDTVLLLGQGTQGCWGV